MSGTRAAGTLTVVGTGHLIASQVTTQAAYYLRTAQRLFCICSPITEEWLRRLNPSCESLRRFYKEGQVRLRSYDEMVEHVLASVRDGYSTCLAIYGHPGVFSYPGRESVQRARRAGYQAQMLPGVSAEDCLFADLRIDPSRGLQTFDATYFVVCDRQPDTSCPLVLWQIGVVASPGYSPAGLWNEAGLKVLADKLTTSYRSNHQVVLYQAGSLPGFPPIIRRVPISQLQRSGVTTMSTLYIPPRRSTIQRKQNVAIKRKPAVSGSLTIVGLGYGIAAHVTPETLHYLKKAGRLLYMVYDKVTERWLQQINSHTRSLLDCVDRRWSSRKCCNEIVGCILETVRLGGSVCVAWSGHPTVCVAPTVMALERAEREGFKVRLLPAISAPDCLFADLAVDPSVHGCRTIDAGILLARPIRIDSTVPLIVLQAAVVAQRGAGLATLEKRLRAWYSSDHMIVLYESALYPGCRPVIRRLRLCALASAHISFQTTMYVPPLHAPIANKRLYRNLVKTSRTT